MTTGGAKALQYAEANLGVHKVYEEAQIAAARLAEAREAVVKARHEKGFAEREYTDAEYEFVTAQRSQLGEMSQTAFDKAIKVAINKEPRLRAMRGDLAQRSTSLEYLEASVSRLRVDVEIATSRMTELGGYLAYLAAIKSAETAAKYQQQSWPPPTA